MRRSLESSSLLFNLDEAERHRVEGERVPEDKAEVSVWTVHGDVELAFCGVGEGEGLAEGGGSYGGYHCVILITCVRGVVLGVDRRLCCLPSVARDGVRGVVGRRDVGGRERTSGERGEIRNIPCLYREM